MNNQNYRIALEIEQGSITKDEFRTLLLNSLQSIGNVEADQVSVRVNRVTAMTVDPGTAEILAAVITLSGVIILQMISHVIKSAEMKNEFERRKHEDKKLQDNHSQREAELAVKFILEILVSNLRQQHQLVPDNVRAIKKDQDEA